MRVLIDTNVILDYLFDRKPYSDDARKIVIACKQKRIEGCIAAHSISNGMCKIMESGQNE